MKYLLGNLHALRSLFRQRRDLIALSFIRQDSDYEKRIEKISEQCFQIIRGDYEGSR